MYPCIMSTTLALLTAIPAASQAEAPSEGLPARSPGITLVTHSPPAVTLVAETSEGVPGAYGIGVPMQVGPRTAVLLCNVRTIGAGRHDHEDGTDAFTFGDLGEVAAGGPVQVCRNEHETDAQTGERRMIVKFPSIGGFVPHGARRADGSEHPAAGTGFGICQALSFPAEEGEGLLTWQGPFRRYLEVHQFAFDGTEFSVTDTRLIRSEGLLPIGDTGWHVITPGLTSAIPDGDDLLFSLLARRDDGGGQVCGVSRWRHVEGAWRPIELWPVAVGSEPSLVRGADSRLYFNVRPDRAQGEALLAWAARSAEDEWEQIVDVADARPTTPVSINRAADGAVFLVANHPGTHRDRLSLWEVAPGTSLGPPRLVRHCSEEFGPPPAGTRWFVDHASSATVRLRDGAWRSVLAYRVLAFPRVGEAEQVTPQTGCYLEEVHFAGEAIPPWNFAD